ncbi:hypothetical protein PanWU01x14_216860, partial [Parasponia andersonii]
MATIYAQVTNINESYFEEPNTSRRPLDLFDDKNLSKKENQERINEEKSQDNT